MAKRVLFLAGPCGRDVWMWTLYKEVNKRQEIEPHFITLRQSDVDFLRSKNIKPNQITKIHSFQDSKIVDKEYLAQCEKKYDLRIWDFWNIPLARNKKRAKIPNKTVLGYFQNAFSKIEKLAKEINPDYYLSYGTAGYDTAIFKEVLRKRGTHVMEMTPGFINGKFSFSKDLSNKWDFLDETYQKFKKHDISKKQKEEVDKFMHSFKNKEKKPSCVQSYKEPIFKKIRKYFGYGIKFLRYRNLPPNIRVYFWPIIQKTYDKLNIFEKARKNEKFALFPLHFTPEASTLIYGKWHVDQANLIETIAKSLPVTHTLYVKEHPFGYGNRSLSFYKKLKKLPNVRIISPYEDNFELVKKCSLLLTITGTSGWEAFLLGKPCIAFGDTFYKGADSIVCIESLKELPDTILNNIDKKPNLKDIDTFLAAVLETTYQGLARLPGDCNNHSLEKRNIKMLTDAFLEHIKKLQKSKK